MNTNDLYVCKQCSSEFQPKRKDQVFCTPTCYRVCDRGVRRTKYFDKQPLKPCAICGTMFTGFKSHKYCSTPCQVEGQKRYLAKRRVIKKGQHSIWLKNRVQQLRREVMDGYGGPVCRCCGETTYEFLSLDHIDGGGTQHRKQYSNSFEYYRWIITSNFPPIFQVLCHNCNLAKGFYGVCPHTTNAQDRAA